MPLRPCFLHSFRALAPLHCNDPSYIDAPCFISGQGMAISKNDSHGFVAGLVPTEKRLTELSGPPRGGSVSFFPWSKFWSVSGLLNFWKPPCLIEKARLNALETHARIRDQSSRAPERASEPQGLLPAWCFSQPGMARGFRLLGADLGCLACVHCAPPLRPGPFLLQGGRALASEGVFA